MQTDDDAFGEREDHAFAQDMIVNVLSCCERNAVDENGSSCPGRSQRHEAVSLLDNQKRSPTDGAVDVEIKWRGLARDFGSVAIEGSALADAIEIVMP